MCGSDLVLNYGRWERAFPMVCVARPPYIEDVKEEILNHPSEYKKNFYLISENTKDVSSTKVRKLLFKAKWEELEKSELISKEVLLYLKTKYEENTLKEDDFSWM
eukprot:c12009_g1_i2.p1 GENE.c12009_g1_i2~~c12009_g1_i2.p1  ORF type:complete len:105 (-),score=39.43 c12009_g1_i2:21-335(-)